MISWPLVKWPPKDLLIYVITERPKDYPDKFVTRLWLVGVDGRQKFVCPAATHDTLDEAREALPPGLTRIERHRADDPVIVESWL